LAALNVSNITAPGLTIVSENTLGSYDNVIKFEMTETEAKSLITYQKLANEVLAFYTDISKFNITGTRTGGKKQIGAFDFTHSNVLGPDGTTDLNHSIAFNFTQHQVKEKYGVSSVDIIKDSTSRINTLKALINTTANQKISSTLSKIDCNNPTGDKAGLTQDSEGKWFTNLSGFIEDEDETVNVATAMYNTIAANFKSRLETNIATNGVYYMPIIQGDTFRFLINLVGTGAFASVAKTYLVIIEVVA
jgi:hypothetical protein